MRNYQRGYDLLDKRDIDVFFYFQAIYAHLRSIGEKKARAKTYEMITQRFYIQRKMINRILKKVQSQNIAQELPHTKQRAEETLEILSIVNGNL